MSSSNLQCANFFTRLLDVERELRLKRIEIAAKTGFSPSMISSVMKGSRQPSKRFIQLFCSSFGVSENWLTTGEGEMLVNPRRPPEITSLSYKKPGSIKEAALQYFQQCGIMPSVAEQVIEELSKLDKGHQLIEAGKIVNDVADILHEMDNKNKK